MTSLLNALRHETSDLHNALHHHPMMKACQENCLNREDYMRMLTAFSRPWQTLFPAIETVPIVALRACLTRRAEALHNDLTALGVASNMMSEEGEAAVVDEGQLLGICYVLVGSSLGATLLQENVKTVLGTAAVSYLSLSPRDSGWPLLVKHLRSAEANDYPAASGAAKNAFAQIDAELSKPF